MRPLLLALLLTLGSIAAYGQAPNCQFTQTFTATGYGVTVSNQAVANLGTQCVTWRLSYYADNMTALSIQVEGAPDSNGAPGTFAAVPTTACSSTQQPPCTLDGSNPLTDKNHATVAFRGYYAWIALHVTIFTSGGSHSSITAQMYGDKGTSPSAGNRGGGGSGSGTVNSGTATHLPYYATTTNAVSDAGADLTFDAVHTWTLGASGIFDASTSGAQVKVVTQSQTDSSTKAASTAFVSTAVANAIAGVNPAVAVQASTTAAGDTSGLTYANGVGGIGATFTGSVNTAITIDGYTFTAVGQRLLVKNDTQAPSGAFNGVYSLSQVQTIALPPIFTRASDYNQPSDINNTGAIPVVNGTANALTSWLLTSAVSAVGTDALTYARFSYAPTAPTTARTWNYSFQGVDYGGVPAFAGNIPATGAPTAKLNSGGDLAVLDFPIAQSTYYWYGSWRMPPAYPASGAITYVFSSMCDPAACDSTDAANVYISLACSGTTARPDAPSYVELTAPVAITNNATGYQTITSGTITPGAGTPTLPACATTNRATVKLRVDTSANSLTGSFQLVAVNFYVQGQI